MPRSILQIPVTVAQVGSRMVEIRCAQGNVLAKVDGAVNARDIIKALEDACGPDEQIAVTLYGMHPDSWGRPLVGPPR